MTHGDVVSTKSIRVILGDGYGWADFKAPKGEQFVLLLLGAEEVKAGGRKLDPIAALNALGWHAEASPPPKQEAE